MSPTSFRTSPSRTTESWNEPLRSRSRHHWPCADLRLHQRFPRCRQLHRDRSIDACPAAGSGRRLGRHLQLPRGISARNRRRRDHRQRLRQCPSDDALGGARRPAGRNRVGSVHLVSRSAHQFFARPDRRICRRRVRQGGFHRPGGRKMGHHSDFHCAFPADRPGRRLSADGGRLLDLSTLHSHPDGSPFPPLPAGLGRAVQLRARDQ